MDFEICSRVPWMLIAILGCCSSISSTRSAEDSKYTEAREEIRRKYGVEPMRWLGWADELKERKVVAAFESAAKGKFKPSLLYTLAIGEGLNLWINANYIPGDPGDVNVKAKVDGFAYLGTDFFGDDIKRLKSEKWLPDTFAEKKDYELISRVNEKGQKVNSAVFADLDRALIGFTAMLASRRRTVEQDAERENLKLDEDKLVYWTYDYYLEGEKAGQKELVDLKGDFSKSTRTEVRSKVITRLATWRYVQWAKLFTE